MNQLTLYTTSGCHLCELAFQQLQQLDTTRFVIDTVDIALDEALVEEYGTSIPVIQFPDQSTIAWPFEFRDIETKLASDDR